MAPKPKQHLSGEEQSRAVLLSRGWSTAQVDELHDRLEEEALIFMKMGFGIRELFIAMPVDCPEDQHVVPTKVLKD